jgi:UDP-glucose 4-epimerase
MHNLKILVTGGAGFIGSHLIAHLLKGGYETTVFDNLYSGEIENIKQYMDNKGFHLIKGDVRSSKDVEAAVKSIDAVCHLAAIVNIPLSIENPLFTEDVNVNGTLKLLRACAKHNVPRFVYVSTCAVYGEASCLPIKEEHPTNPLSPYGASKLAAEHYCNIFSRIYGLQTVCLRLFNVYGSKQPSGPYGGVITTFLESLKKRKSLVIYGDGNQTRDFIYVADVAKACVLALQRKNCSGKTFNIGTGVQTSINELAQVLIRLMNRPKTKVIHRNERKGDIKESYADISKAKEELGFKWGYSISDGLKKMIEELD